MLGNLQGCFAAAIGRLALINCSVEKRTRTHTHTHAMTDSWDGACYWTDSVALLPILMWLTGGGGAWLSYYPLKYQIRTEGLVCARTHPHTHTGFHNHKNVWDLFWRVGGETFFFLCFVAVMGTLLSLTVFAVIDSMCVSVEKASCVYFSLH